MATRDTHAGDPQYRQALFSLPEAAPGSVLRAGQLLAKAGYLADALALYEQFIAGLQQHALTPLPSGPGTAGDGDGGWTAKDLLGLLPVRAHPERYSLA